MNSPPDPLVYPPYEPITNREMDILRLKIKGHSNQEIADQLFLALTTIKWYVRQIYNKLGVNNRREAAALVQEMGLLDENTAQIALPKHNLPAQTTPFIGREQELRQITALLAKPHTRLVTITGPGGMGKTRLALEAAEQQLGNFENVYFIALGSVITNDVMMSTIAEQTNIRIREDGRPLKTRLLEALRTKSMLLVLDNFEQLLEYGWLVSEILQSAPGTKVLVTSREKLNLSGETIFSLAGLTLPEMNPDSDVLAADAVRLFIQSAQRINANFRPRSTQLPHLARVCHMVQGMPLALLLAAAWIDTLSPGDIAEEINHSIGVLQANIRDVPDRHRSIRAVFDPTWARLTSQQQAVLRKLAVFQQGFTRQAAEIVADATLQILQTLVNKSLLSRTGNGRYILHELLRQYAMEQLTMMDETDSAYEAHCVYFAEFMEQRTAEFFATRQVEALDEIEADYENIQQAWGWAVDHKQMHLVRAMIDGLYWVGHSRIFPERPFKMAMAKLAPASGEMPHIVWVHLQVRSWYFQEAPHEKLRNALAVAETHHDDHLRAICLQTLGWLTFDSDHDYEGAISLYEQSLAIRRQQNNTYAQSDVLTNIGRCYSLLGQNDLARACFQESLALGHQLGNLMCVTSSLARSGDNAFFNGNYTEATAFYEETLARMPAVISKWEVSWNKIQLGLLTFLKGDFEKTEMLAQEIVQSIEAGGYTLDELPAHLLNNLLACIREDYAYVLSHATVHVEKSYWSFVGAVNNLNKAMAAYGLENDRAAEQYLHAALVQSTKSPALQTWCLPLSAVLLARRGTPARAAQLLGLAFSYPHSGTGWMKHWPLLTQLSEQLQATLGEAAFQAAWAQGAALDLSNTTIELTRTLES